MKLPKRFAAVGSIPVGRSYLVIGHLCWGRGLTLEKAVENCRKAGGSHYKPGSSKTLVYHASGKSYVDDDGSVVTPAGEERPVEIGRFC